MAAPPPPGGPPHAQFSLPPITPEQQYVQQRQQAEVKREVNYLNTLDANEPFANLQDAVMRLLPFHLFNSVDPALADLDDTPDHMGADLMASRHDAWEQLVIDKVNDLRKRADMSGSHITDLEARMDRDALSGTRSIDHYAMARLQQEDLRRKVATDKADLQKLLPPAAAPAAPAAAAAAGAGGRGPSAAGAAAGAAGGLTGLQAAAAAVAARGQPRPQQPVVLPAVQQQLLLQQLQQQQLIAQLPVQQQMALRQHLIQHALQVQQQQQVQGGQGGQLPAGAQAQQQAAYMQLLQQQALQQQQQQLLAQLAQQQAQQRK